MYLDDISTVITQTDQNKGKGRNEGRWERRRRISVSTFCFGWYNCMLLFLAAVSEELSPFEVNFTWGQINHMP